MDCSRSGRRGVFATRAARRHHRDEPAAGAGNADRLRLAARLPAAQSGAGAGPLPRPRPFAGRQAQRPHQRVQDRGPARRHPAWRLEFRLTRHRRLRQRRPGRRFGHRRWQAAGARQHHDRRQRAGREPCVVHKSGHGPHQERHAAEGNIHRAPRDRGRSPSPSRGPGACASRGRRCAAPDGPVRGARRRRAPQSGQEVHFLHRPFPIPRL
jgi:hypothetical protein